MRLNIHVDADLDVGRRDFRPRRQVEERGDFFSDRHARLVILHAQCLAVKGFVPAQGFHGLRFAVHLGGLAELFGHFGQVGIDLAVGQAPLGFFVRVFQDLAAGHSGTDEFNEQLAAQL